MATIAVRCFLAFLVEKELNFGDHGYARRNPLPGMEEEDAEGTAEDQHRCTQCQFLKKKLEQEMQHTARLQREVKELLGLPTSLRAQLVLRF